MKEMLEYKVMSNCIDVERIHRLQQKMEKRQASICSQRALLYTESFKQTKGEPYILRKAKAFAYTLDHMSIYIEEDSLIFGNQASRNFAAPIFPEYSIDWVIDELDEFALREGDVFQIDQKTKEELKSIHSYWHGNTHEDEVKKNLPEVNLMAEKQGVLHRGGISMSGDGHIVPKHEKILEVGFLGLIEEARMQLSKTDDQDKIDFYNAVIISLKASLRWVKRYGRLAADMAHECKDVKRRKELFEIAGMCVHLLERKALSFYEAVESVYLVHILQMIESNGHSFCYGRFDQYIEPFYEADLKNKIINEDKALEIITHMFIMNSSLNKVRPYGHTRFSQGYPLYSNLMIGGYRKDGSDGTNDLSYLCIEAMNLCSLAEPNFSMRYNEQTPEALLRLVSKLIRTGCGMPSMFNDDIIVKAKEDLGIPKEDALDYVAIGCVETGIPGKYGHRATGMTYVNWGKLVEILLNNGYDPSSGIRLTTINNNEKTKESDFHSYEDVWQGWKKLLKYYTNLAVDCDHICDYSLAKYDADPFASSLIDNCLEKGKILKLGGAQYDIISQSNIGPSVVGNSFAVLKKLVFEEKKLTLEELKKAMEDNWQSLESKKIHQMVKKVEKFGNDEDYVDEIVVDIFNSYLELLPDYKTTAYGKGPQISKYTMSTSNITSYVPNGLDVGATPDGRMAKSPLNEGCSPTEGTDVNGPTAVINSVSKLPNGQVAAGQLLNMRFSPEALEGDNLDTFVSFLKVCCKKGIYHNQFNVVDSDVLRLAQKEPENYTDLIVRVAGYCAQFVSLMSDTQDAIIHRSENRF